MTALREAFRYAPGCLMTDSSGGGMSYTEDYNWRAEWTDEQLAASHKKHLYDLSRSLRQAQHETEELLALAIEFKRRRAEAQKASERP